jgi:hypothetical protein
VKSRFQSSPFECNLQRYTTVTYMVSSIQYGGRITDPFDELLMDTYATKYFNENALTKVGRCTLNQVDP